MKDAVKSNLSNQHDQLNQPITDHPLSPEVLLHLSPVHKNSKLLRQFRRELVVDLAKLMVLLMLAWVSMSPSIAALAIIEGFDVLKDF